MLTGKLNYKLMDVTPLTLGIEDAAGAGPGGGRLVADLGRMDPVNVLAGHFPADAPGAGTARHEHGVAVDPLVDLDQHRDFERGGVETFEALRRNLEAIADVHVRQVVVQVLLDVAVRRVTGDQHVGAEVEDAVDRRQLRVDAEGRGHG